MSKHKEFGLSSWAIYNRTTVYIFTIIVIISGIIAYNTMPREDFPEIIENKIYITSIFPGNSCEDIEKLITEPIEKKLKNQKGVLKVSSTSYQDFSMIIVEFDDNTTVEQSKQKAKDELDNIINESNWPSLDNGSKVTPTIFNINIAEETPILNINIKADYPSQEVKKVAELMKDDIENISEIKEVEILGVGEKEIEIAIDLYKMTASQVSFDDIQRAVKSENITISGGQFNSNGLKRNVRVVGEITEPKELENIVVKSMGGTVLLKDVADVEFKEMERKTFAREKGKEVIMLSIKKRSSQNMITAIYKIKELLNKAHNTYIPKDYVIELTGDQSSRVEHSVSELSNHIIFGIILVMFVLMFTMGLRNSLFVGSAIPISMLMAFAFINLYGVTLNTMVLFALVMGLGMLVDDGIVVVDNVYVNLQNGMNRIDASKFGIGEIAWPVISSTATTLAAFFPLGLWPGTMGKFMIYFPATLSVVLGASLIVALIINASMTAGFINLKDENLSPKRFKKYSILLFAFALISIGLGFLTPFIFFRTIANLLFLSILALFCYHKFIFKYTQKFQYSFFPKLEEKYANFLKNIIIGGKSLRYFFGIIGLLIASFILLSIFPRNVLFFPDNVPNMNFVYIELPQGTDINKTNMIVKKIENQVMDILAKKTAKVGGINNVIQSVTSQIGLGSGNIRIEMGNKSDINNKGKITILYKEFKDRKGISSQEILEELKKEIKQTDNEKITIEKEQNGPSVGYPISLEVNGDNYVELLSESKKIIEFINSKKIEGIEKLNTDVSMENPELTVKVDRLKAGNALTSSMFVGYTLRSSIYGQEVDNYKYGKDNYKINLRLKNDQRNNENIFLNQSMIYRNQMNGQMMQVPISSLATSQNTNTFNFIKRNKGKKVITIYSNIKEGFNSTQITKKIKQELKGYKLSKNNNINFSGEQEEQEKNQKFLMLALLYALLGVATIIMLQFNSSSKTIIIMSTVLLSFSGVFLGYIFTNMDFVILMTMMGIISLAGVVVKNGIVLIDFFNLILDRKISEHNVSEHHHLNINEIIDAIVLSGKSRLRPVILTATTAVLGLIPLAIGLNFDFFSFVSTLNPHIYFGGDNVIFWAPLAWTIIFGLTYATILTLLIVPIMFFIVMRYKNNRYNKQKALKE